VTDGFDAVAARLAQDLRRDCRQMATVMLADPTIAPLRMSMLLLLARLADGAVPTIKETRRVASAWARFQKRAHQDLASRIGGNAEHERAPYIARSSLKSARRGQTQGAHLFGAFRPGLARPEQISFAHVLLSIGKPAFAAEMVRRLGQGRIAAPVPGLSLKPDEDTAELAFLGARVRLAQGDAKGAWFAAVAALA
jgi:hypothetical protein